LRATNPEKLQSKLVERVLKGQQKIDASPFRLWYLKNDQPISRLIFIISSSKVPRAVVRNKIRRIGKEVFRARKNFLVPLDLVIGVREKSVKQIQKAEIWTALEKIFEKLKTL